MHKDTVIYYVTFFMNTFSKIAMIGTFGAMLALPVFAKERPAPTATQLACVQTAVGKREDAVMSAVDSYTSAWKSALSTRKTALTAAWNITVNKDRNAAIRSAWNAFKSAKRDAMMTHRTAIKAAWGAFKTDRRACGPSAGEPSESQGTDQG